MKIDKDKLGELYGKVGVGNQTLLGIMGRNRDISVGEIFMIYSDRDGNERVFFFRVLGLENYLRQVDDMSRIAGTLMVEGDAYLSGIDRNMLLSLGGRMLGYAEKDEKGEWTFKSPRRLPDHLASVYRPVPGTSDEFVQEMLACQTDGEVHIGDLQVGEKTLNVPVKIPIMYLPMHVGIFGSTGAGKSNLMMVLIKSIIDTNLDAIRNPNVDKPRLSAFCIDPHDEFAKGVDKYGIQSIINDMSSTTRSDVIGDFYYLTTHKSATRRDISAYTREIRILWSEIQPRDLYSIREYTSEMSSFIDSQYSAAGENWIESILSMDEDSPPVQVQVGTLRAVKRRLSFLQRSPIFIDSGTSILDEIFIAMETGRILVVNTSLMSDMEQFLLTTIVTRTLSDMRRALKSSGNLGDFETQGQMRLPNSFFNRVKQKARSFYGKDGFSDKSEVRDPRNLPVIQVTVEEAPSILNPVLMRGQSVFKDISRQGRKFNIGLLVVSQQVSVLDNVILSQMNTEINLRLGNEREIKACIENASVNINGFENEFRVMSRGEAIVTASYRELPLPARIPLFDTIYEKDKHRYKDGKSKKEEEHIL
ncbi:MAG: ATP-binding protein [Candidatus Thorarchaeota archaeon]